MVGRLLEADLGEVGVGGHGPAKSGGMPAV